MFKATNQRRVRPTLETDMSNTIATKRVTARIRLALLALGAISLSATMTVPAAAGDDAPDAGTNNPSNCRTVVNHKCLTKPNDGQSSKNQDTRNQDNAAAARAQNAADRAAGFVPGQGPNDPVIVHQAKDGTIISVDYPKQGITERSYPTGILRTYGNGQHELIYSRGQHDLGGNGGAAGHTGSRIAAPLPAGARTSATATVPKSTATDKLANTMTRDYRTGATAAPGGPPPAAAIGTKPTATALAAQSGTRDHRH
jgi:hypothetical protein